MENCLYIVIPCYNEENVMPITSVMFLDKLKELIKKKKVSDSSRILFVDDGSKDKTWDIICDLAKQDRYYIGISQSRNRGHQNAVLAGLMEAKELCDITISIDCDGQDDINVIEDMVDAYLSGNDIVYGVRDNRDSDTFFKRVSAQSFYKLLTWMGVECIYNHADYRLISNKVLQSLAEFKEVNIFLRGMIPLVGYKSTCVYYTREERLAGKSHYPLKKMMSLAIDGITSLSIKPIRMITTFGLVVSLTSSLGILWSIVQYYNGHTIDGWTSLICIILFMNGIQILSLGIIGEYIGKVYLETKRRPRYIINKRTCDMIIDKETS